MTQLQNGHSGLENQIFQKDRLESIGVTGFALNFPQDASDTEGFWQMLLEGRSAMTEVPEDRWNINAFYHPNSERSDTMNARGGHFLKKNTAVFDAPFFSLSPGETACMDPQQRGLLECSYHALENAGIPIASIIGSRTSVFVGSFSREYETVISRDPQLQAKYLATGTGSSMLANRLSWFYDLRGPSISLDTACSSSLTALHLAVQSIRTGESDMALVAGCNLILNPETNSIPLSNLGFLGQDSVCYSFDHRANGYARGEGTAVVVLKSVSNAVTDNDVIRAVVRNSGSNQDGRTPGITQPSKEAQVALIRETYDLAGLDVRGTGFFEAHGTGTPVGDPIEASAIGTVFKDDRDEAIVVGAVKSNIGHLEGASGLAGLIKTILVLERGIIPRNIWYEKPNPAISVEDWKIKFPTKTISWPRAGLRRASVNSFGYGGANAHVIIEDAHHYLKARKIHGKHRTATLPSTVKPATLISNGDRRNGCSSDPIQPTCSESEHKQPRLFTWSASDEGGLERLATSYRNYLCNFQGATGNFLDDLAFTLSDKRSKLPWKSFLIADSASSLEHALASHQMKNPVRSFSSNHPLLAFVFTGQGAQWYAMGRELSIYPEFRDSIRSAEKYLRLMGCEWLLTEELGRNEESSHVDDPAYAQPLCTALQVAMVELFSHWNIFPAAVVGHSSGEIAAAYCAGGISRESAWKLAYHRGFVAAELARMKVRNGSMIAVALSLTDVQPYLDQVTQLGQGRIVVGCVNSPRNLTLTGDTQCINTMKSLMDRDSIFARKLEVNVAYHSWHMEDVALKYREMITDIVPGSDLPNSQRLPKFFSSVSGVSATVEELCKPEYWVNNLVSQVQFLDAMREMSTSLLSQLEQQTDGARIFLIEIGPRAALRRPIQEILNEDLGFKNVTYATALSHNTSALESVMTLIGHLHCSGSDIDLPAINSPHLLRSELNLVCDLPGYPFNHSQAYWLESRISKNFRFREFPRHELLGIRTTDWNPREPKWRNTIRASELPWIKDHQFNGSRLYPAAGILVMAIEAARQISSSHYKVTNYILSEVSFLKPLLVTLAPEGVETQFHMRPQTDDGTISAKTHSFKLYLLSSDEWLEICCGQITTEYEDKDTGNDPSATPNSQKICDLFKQRASRCRRALDSTDLYENLENLGFGFGPTFQALEDVFFCTTFSAKATIDPRGWVGKVQNSHLTMNHVIHPTVLDAVMQLTAVAFSKGTWEPIETMVPTKIRKLWISNDLIAHKEGQRLQILAEQTFKGFRDTEYMVCAVDNIQNECQILCEGYRGTSISSLESSTNSFSGWKRHCFNIDWRPDLDLLTSDQLSSHCNALVNASDLYPIDLFDKVEVICSIYLQQTLETLSVEGFTSTHTHVNKYIDWMRKQCDRSMSADSKLDIDGETPGQNNKAQLESILSELGSGWEIDLVTEVGRNLVPILRNEVDVLGIIFEEELVQGFYNGPTFRPSYKKAAAYLDLLAHKNPMLSILEIGAGTGGCTAPILSQLAHHGLDEFGQPRFGQYDYTDISPGFFEAAKARFYSHSERMRFRVLDIEKSPASQGFDGEKYDVVLASAVLHATANIEKVLMNVRELLKPGGKLIFIEPCNLDALRISFIFGLLPGWWLSVEDYRRQGPLLSDIGWDQVLKQTGFSGADLCLRDSQGRGHSMSFIVSTAPDVFTPSTPAPRRLIIVPKNDISTAHLADSLKSQLASHADPSTDIVPLTHFSSRSLQKTFCICLLETNHPFFYQIQEAHWTLFKSMVQSANRIIWVTRGRECRPELGLVTGIGRSLRSEIPSLQFIELALEQESSDAVIVRHITNILDRSENEYLEQDNMLYINRVVEANYLNDRLYSRLCPQKPRASTLGQRSENVLSLIPKVPGDLDTLQFQESPSSGQDLATEEVEVEVKAIGVNFKDVMVALGQIPSNTLGLECSGVVLRKGPEVSKVTLGTRVCCIVVGAYQDKVRVHSAAVARIPESLSFATAAAFPLSFCVAYQALIKTARLKQADTVFVYSGAGSFGQAAIQLSQMMKASVYCTVESEEKKDFLVGAYQLPRETIFVGTKTSSLLKIKQVRGGVDVLLNSRGSDGLQNSLGCIKPFGRIVDISPTEQSTLRNIPGIDFSQNITYATVDLPVILEHSKPVMEELLSSVMTLLAEKQIRGPQPVNVYKGSEISAAFRSLQGGQSMGKIVIQLNEDDLVPIVPSNIPSYQFSGNASYVVVGGFGGLGKSIARWMTERGAKNLILLGRSGAKGKEALDFLDEMKDMGVRVASPPCDISEENALLSVLEMCSRTMPPVKGCIQGSMVLKDGLLENMPVADYQAVIRPKAHGSWNLHKHLPKDMDFFILLASTGGVIGTRGQSNYASGNTYQDALAHYRVKEGLKCISLDLGLVLSVGFASENRSTIESFKRLGYRGIREAEFLAILDYCCDPALPMQSSAPFRSQIVSGLEIPKKVMEKDARDGMDWARWARSPLFRNLVMMDGLHDHVTDSQAGISPGADPPIDFRALFATENCSVTTAARAIGQGLRRKLAKQLWIPEEDIDIERPVHSYGVDSLVAVELRYWLAKEVRSDLSIFEIMGDRSLTELSVEIAQKSAYYQ